MPKSELHTGHVTETPHSGGDRRCTAAMLQLAGIPASALECAGGANGDDVRLAREHNCAGRCAGLVEVFSLWTFFGFLFFLPVSGMGFPFFLIFIFFIHPGAAASSTSATTAAA